MKHLLTLQDLGVDQLSAILDLADEMKTRPEAFANTMAGRTLLMMFEKPSLRTRVSFETGFHKMGGHAIYYNLMTSPLGAGKESVSDMAKVLSRYVDIVMARLFEHSDIEELAADADVPVINALTNFSHPCQILADFQTLREKKGRLEGLRLAYYGDANNNVTHSLMFGCELAGIECVVACPDDAEYRPAAEVLAAAPSTRVVHEPGPAGAIDADVIYADTWMSYHIKKDEMDRRRADLEPFQVNTPVMAAAKADAVFMNCLPAHRGAEQTAEVIDGPQSIVFDQAENRMWAQNALMALLMRD